MAPRPAWPDDLIASSFANTSISIQGLSNPSRLFLCNREIVLVRDNLSSLASRASLGRIIPALSGEHCPSVLQALVEQSNCFPFPMNIIAKAWDFDHSLTLYPLPHYVPIAPLHL
jgi:hypothetical protein